MVIIDRVISRTRMLRACPSLHQRKTRQINLEEVIEIKVFQVRKIEIG